MSYLRNSVSTAFSHSPSANPSYQEKMSQVSSNGLNFRLVDPRKQDAETAVFTQTEPLHPPRSKSFSTSLPAEPRATTAATQTEDEDEQIQNQLTSTPQDPHLKNSRYYRQINRFIDMPKRSKTFRADIMKTSSTDYLYKNRQSDSTDYLEKLDKKEQKVIKSICRQPKQDFVRNLNSEFFRPYVNGSFSRFDAPSRNENPAVQHFHRADKVEDWRVEQSAPATSKVTLRATVQKERPASQYYEQKPISIAPIRRERSTNSLKFRDPRLAKTVTFDPSPDRANPFQKAATSQPYASTGKIVETKDYTGNWRGTRAR